MRRTASALLLCGAVLANAATASRAQGVAETILPDRPGLGDGAHVVGSGVLQLEVGLEVSLGRGSDVITLGQSLLRYGVGGLEIRVLPGSIAIQDEDLGALDPALGLKLPLGGEDGPHLSALLATTLPIGSEVFSSREASGAATLIGEFALTDALGLALNAGYGFPYEDFGDGSFGIIVTPGLSTGLDGLGLYAGYAGSMGPGDDTHIVEAGLAFASDADTQLDFNWGIDTDSRRWFLGAGVAHRWR